PPGEGCEQQADPGVDADEPGEFPPAGCRGDQPAEDGLEGEAREPRGGEGGGPQGVFRAHTGGPQRGRNQGKQPEGEGEAARQSKGAGGSAIGDRLLRFGALTVV